VALDLRITAPVDVNVVRPHPVLVPREVAPAGETEFAPRRVAEPGQRAVQGVHEVDVPHDGKDVYDRLGGQAGHGGAPDVVHLHEVLPENGS
jgi:hypothetical protein